MSTLWRRAVRLAQSNFNNLKERATSIGGSGQSLEDMSDKELEAELERRRKEHATRAAVEESRRRAGEDDDHPESGRSRKRSKGSESASSVDLSELSPQKRRQFRQYYANLELPFGANLEEVKHAYRRLMRQYHPDKHQNDPARRQLATQLSQKLTVAYNELSQVLKKKK